MRPTAGTSSGPGAIIPDEKNKTRMSRMLRINKSMILSYPDYPKYPCFFFLKPANLAVCPRQLVFDMWAHGLVGLDGV
jgi:hypothetical protein